jgi:hypothetical protein
MVLPVTRLWGLAVVRVAVKLPVPPLVMVEIVCAVDVVALLDHLVPS